MYLLPGYTYQCGINFTDIKIQTLQDKDLTLLLENNTRGGINSNLGDRYVKSDENKKIIYIGAINLYGHSRSQFLPYDENEIWHCHRQLYMNKLEEIFKHTR